MMQKFYVVIGCFLLFTRCGLIKAQGILLTDFNPKIDLVTGKYPVGVAIVDLDKDGKADLVVSNEGAQTISLFRNVASGTTISAASFSTKVDIVLSGVNPERIMVADIDGDGWPDLVISSSNGKTLSILRNTSSAGSIGFAVRVDITVGYYAHSLSIGNIDADTKPDIAVANFDAGVVTLFKNTSTSGSISFGSGVDVITGGNPTAVSIGDLDGDSHADLAVVIHDRGLVSVFRNTNDSINTNNFKQRLDFSAGSSPYAAQIADMDLDGHADLVVSNIDKNNTVSVLRNITSGSTINFSSKVEFITGTHPYSISIKDIDGNGKPDILVGNWFNTGTVSVLQNVSTLGSIAASSFLPRVDLPAGSNPESVAAGDLNADGYPDIVAANSFAGTISVLQYYPIGAPHPALSESSASVSNSSFVSVDLMDNEWKQEAPPGYVIAGDNGTTINAGLNAGNNAGRFVYLWAIGSRTPLTPVQGNLTFTAKGSGTITVQIMASSSLAVQASQTFTLTGAYADYSWVLSGLYPQTEYIMGVIFKGGSGTTQASGQFKKNFCLTLRQAGMTGSFTRFRADSTSLIGNAEKAWYGWSDTANAQRKKYLQHSAFARMRFQTSATTIALEYVRDFYDRRVVNLFDLNQTFDYSDFDAAGKVISGYQAVNTYTHVIGGHTYTISGLTTTNPQYLWYDSAGNPIGTAGVQYFNNLGTASAPVYQITAPAGATQLALLVQRATDVFTCYTSCMIQDGAIGTVTAVDGTIPSPYTVFAGYVPSLLSGPAIFINGQLYKYYQVEGTDVAKVVQFLTDTLPAGNKAVEVMMPGQGSYAPADPHVRRAGDYLRAVYFPGATTTISPANTVVAGSVLFIHDSILSGYNISNDAQNNVWMMKMKRDPSFGFTGDIFSEGYAGRLLSTDIGTPALTAAFATKLASFGVDKFWFQAGINDYGYDTPMLQFYTQYKSLIEQLKALRPNVKIYIQCIGPAAYEGANGETVDGYKNTGPAANDYRDIQRAIATSHSYCEYVNFEGLFPGTVDYLADGIHPTDVANLVYANGIKNKSTLLGAVLPDSALAFFRSTKRFLSPRRSGIHIITAKGGKAPYVFTLLSGTLPSGLTFNNDGTITGTPATGGSVLLSVKVTDANSTSVTQTDTLFINAVPVIKVTPAVVEFTANTSANTTFQPTGGTAPYGVTVTSSSVPPGMTFNSSTYVLSGVPTTTGNYLFTFSATDSLRFSGSSTDTVRIIGAPPAEDSLTLTAFLSASNHLLITGHLKASASDTLYVNIGAYYTSNSAYIGYAQLAIPKTVLSATVDVAPMALVAGTNYPLILNIGTILPATTNAGITTIVNKSSTQVNVTPATTSPSEQLTLSAVINTGGHLIVTAHLPNVSNNEENTYIGAYYAPPGGVTVYLTAMAVNIAAGQLNSPGIDFGAVSGASGPGYNIRLEIGSIYPDSGSGLFITYTTPTYQTITKP